MLPLRSPFQKDIYQVSTNWKLCGKPFFITECYSCCMCLSFGLNQNILFYLTKMCCILQNPPKVPQKYHNLIFIWLIKTLNMSLHYVNYVLPTTESWCFNILNFCAPSKIGLRIRVMIRGNMVFDYLTCWHVVLNSSSFLFKQNKGKNAKNRKVNRLAQIPRDKFPQVSVTFHFIPGVIWGSAK